jgi:hypothetical protein
MTMEGPETVRLTSSVLNREYPEDENKKDPNCKTLHPAYDIKITKWSVRI